MRLPLVAGIVAAVPLLAGAALWTAHSTKRPAPTAPIQETAPLPGPADATPLALRELLDSGPKLRPSAKARALDGKRVRIAGFMAELEEPMAGAFYLVPRPLRLDESGGGTGDLPLESVLVIVPGSEGKPVPHVDGALEGTGVLEVGNRADPEGRVSNFRLHLDGDQRLVAARTR
jgi:hypothetical protein